MSQFDLQVEEMDDSNFLKIKLFKVIDNQKPISLDELGSSFIASSSSNQSKKRNKRRDQKFDGSRLQKSFMVSTGVSCPFEFRISKNLEIVLKGLQSSATKSNVERSQSKSPKSRDSNKNQNQLRVVEEQADISELINSLRYKAREEVISFEGESNNDTNQLLRLRKRMSYGEGIRVKRLVDGFIRDVYEEDDLNQSENELQAHRRKVTGVSRGCNSSLFEDPNKVTQGRSQLSNNSTLRLYSQKKLDSIAKNKDKRIEPLRYFRYSWVALITLSISTVAYNCMMNLSDTEATSGLMTLERNSALVSSLLQSILARVNDLCLLNEGIDLLYDSEYRGRLNQQKFEAIEALKEEYQELISTHKKFDEMPKSTFAYKLVKKEQDKKIVSMRVDNIKMVNFTYMNALYNTLSVVAKVVRKDKEDIKYGDRDVEFLRYNIANGLHSAIIRLVLTNDEAREMILRTQNVFVWKGTLVFLATNSLLILIVLGTVHFSKKAKERAVECFYGFSDEYIDKNIAICEKFNNFVEEDSTGLEGGGTCSFEISSDSEGGGSRGRGNFDKIYREKSLSKPSSQKRQEESEFIKLKKRKKKGTLVRHFGAWEVAALISISLNIIFFSFKIQNHIAKIVEAVENSRYIFNLNRMYVLPYAMRNTYMAVLVDPKSKARGVPSMGIANFYDNLIITYSTEMLNVSKIEAKHS